MWIQNEPILAEDLLVNRFSNFGGLVSLQEICSVMNYDNYILHSSIKWCLEEVISHFLEGKDSSTTRFRVDLISNVIKDNERILNFRSYVRECVGVVDRLQATTRSTASLD